MQIQIRPLKIQDAHTSYKWRNNPIIWKYTGSHPDKPVTKQMELDWIRKVLSNENERRYAIIAEDKYIGNTYLTAINLESAEFHIFIGDESYWNRGIASKVLELVTNEAISMGLKRLYLTVNLENIAAVALYKKKGFQMLFSRDGILYMSKSLQ